MRAMTASNKRNSSSVGAVNEHQQSGQRKSAKGSSADLGGGCSRPTQLDASEPSVSAAADSRQSQSVGAKNSSKKPSRAGTKNKQNQPDDTSDRSNEINRCESVRYKDDCKIQEATLNQALTPLDHSDDHRKQSHCEIEKRRRDKMNHYIMELAAAIPSFNNNQSKFDKLTVLRMAVQHVKSLRSSLCSFSSFHLRPSFLSSGNLLKNLILQMASQESQDNLFMVVSCDRGKVLFVSQSSKDILNQEQDELVGQCLFDILHKDDVPKVKEQISHFNLMPKEMLVDSKTLQPIKNIQRQSFSQQQYQTNSTPQPGARRSFFCRMKSGKGYSLQPNVQQQPYDVANMVTQQKKETASEPQDNESSISLSNCVPLVNNSSKIYENKSTTELQQIKQQQQVSCNPTSLSSNHSIDLETADMAGQQVPESISTYTTSENSISGEKDIKTTSNKAPNTVESTIKSAKVKRNINKSNMKDRGAKSSTSSTTSSSSSGSIELGSEGSSSGIASGSQNDDRSPRNDRRTEYTKRSGNTKRNNSSAKSSSNNVNNNSSKKHLRYIVMHCTGYLKSITLRSNEFDEDDFDDYNGENNSSDEDENESFRTINCLVAVCRRSPMDRDLKPDRPLTFTCRYSMEGKFVFVDQRTTIALGYTPQQLLGTSHYAYCHKDSVNTFKECHRQSILKSEAVSSDIYQFKRANGQHLWLQTSLKSFRNPWTKFIDYIVANHTTAEGNDPHYNEGCVPTKFNQDMTGEAASQSSSPASSSLSLPSMDSKKSSSPSSSSIGSSQSMDSYNSGASIQALLNQIDRVKSGGVKHALDFQKRRSSHLIRNSTRKSTNDSGNYSDPQSCSSLSSQNSGLSQNSAEFNNLQGVVNFVDNASNQSSNQSINYYQKSNGYRPLQGLCAPTAYQQACQQPITRNPNCSFDVNATTIKDPARSIVDKGSGRTQVATSKQQQRIYNVQYNYRVQAKSGSSTSSDTGNESATWTNSSNSSYSSRPTQPHRSNVTPTVTVQEALVMNDAHHTELCNVSIVERSCLPVEKIHRPPQYVMQSIDNTRMNMVSGQVSMENQMNSIDSTQNYSNQLMPVNTYMDQDADARFESNITDINSLQLTSELQPNIAMTLTDQVERIAQENPPQMNIPMMWNTTSTPYQNLNTIHPTQSEQICTNEDMSLMNVDVGNSNNQIIAQQIVQCQQCANHKCSNQVMMANNSDLNSINLTSLAVDGDLDEDQLLEYLAGCDPEAQLYHIQNNAFPQCNIYR